MKKSFTAKLWKVMRICAVQGAIAIIVCGVTLAHPNYAQLLDKEVTITIVDLPFETALQEIEQVAKVKFAYSISLLQHEPNVSLSVAGGTLRDVLDELLASRGIRYRVHEKESAITLKKMAGDSDTYQSATDKSLRGRRPAPVQVTGTVTESSTQTGMAGVNVVIKGTSQGTTTDVNGKYTIVADDGDVLVFSFIGYVSLEVPVNRTTVIDVVMTEDVMSLGEVVVNAGYWTVKEREQTGNISRITADDIEKQPVNNPLQALQGRMTGVYIQQNTGVPGGGFEIRIRGRNSLRPEGNDPLYIIDGVPFTSSSLTSTLISGSILMDGNALSTINPADIESIEILKDGDATAIYGSRGANGVVLITTKKGQSGKTTVNLSLSTGLGEVSNKLELLNTEQYIGMRNEAHRNSGYWPIPEEWAQWTPDLFYWDTTRHTDWQRELLGNTARTTNAQISVSGGNEHTTFVIGTGYYKETTVFPDDNSLRRLSGNLSLTHRSDDGKLALSSVVYFTHSRNNLLPLDLTSVAVTLPPNAPAIYLEDGDLNWDWNNYDVQNPLRYTKMDYRNNTNNFISNLSASYDVSANVKAKVNAGYTTMTVDEFNTSPLAAIPPQFLAGQTASSNFGNAVIETWIIEPQLVYNRSIRSGHLNFVLGSTFQESQQDGTTITARGFASDAMLENIQGATNWDITSTNYFQYRYSSVFARANYAWNEKIIINLTARRDGSSRFGPGNQFGNFGAIGAAWIFSNKRAIQHAPNWISFGKLRASYGVTGSDAVGNYQYLPTYSPTTYVYDGRTSLLLTRLSNPDYSWEENKKFEVGLDLGLLNDAIRLNTSFYLNRSSNQLVGLPLPLMSGQSSVQFNLPATVQNSGLEVQLHTTNIGKGEFSWNTNINVTIPKNKLLEFPNLETFPQYANSFAVGQSIFVRKTFIFTGVDPETGIYTFEDMNGDGRITTSMDRRFSKEVSQNYFGGINNTLAYKGWQLDVFVQFVKQTGLSYSGSFGSPGLMSNQPSPVANRWVTSGDLASAQKYSFDLAVSNAHTNYAFSDAAIVDASFIRIKNMSLSWNVPEKWIKKIGIKLCRLNVSGQNLLTFTDYPGMDPENRNINFLPPLRVVSFGVNISL